MQKALDGSLVLRKKLYGRLGGAFDGEKPRNFVCLDTRSREMRHAQTPKSPSLFIRKYESSVGEEYFISFEDKLGYLYGFCRLLCGPIAMIRELHVYGNVEGLKVGTQGLKVGTQDVASVPPPLQASLPSQISVQHKGLGKQLMQAAEAFAKQNGYEKIAVISGVGVRGYYRKL
jgi:elongator complex protein 3